MRCRKARAIVLFVVACSLLPWVAESAEPTPAIPIEIQKETTPPNRPAGTLSRLTLQDAERIALDNHPRIRAANERVKVQRAVVGQTKSAYYPSLTLRSAYETTPVTGQTVTSQDGFDFYTVTANVNWLIYDFGRREGTVQGAEDTLDFTRFAEQTSVEDTVLEVRQAFFDYLQAEALVKVEQDTVKDRETLVRQARGFYEVGTRPKIDVARAEANLFASEANLIAAQNGVKIAWARLKNAMGVIRFPKRRVATGVNIQKPSMSLDAAVQTAYYSRPELKEVESQLKAQEEAVSVAKSDYLPRINFLGQYGGRRIRGRDVVFATDETTGDRIELSNPNQSNQTWRARIEFEFPLFSGFDTSYQVQENVRDYYVIRAQQEEIRQRIALEVEEAYLNLIEAGERIKATEAQRRSAKENLDLANGRYQVGVGSIIEITEAQVINTQAQTDHIQSIYDHKIAEAQLARAMGRGLGFTP